MKPQCTQGFGPVGTNTPAQMTLAEAIERMQTVGNGSAHDRELDNRAIATVLRAAKAVSEAPRFDSANLRVRFGKLEEPEIYTIPPMPGHGVRIVREDVL